MQMMQCLRIATPSAMKSTRLKQSHSPLSDGSGAILEYKHISVSSNCGSEDALNEPHHRLHNDGNVLLQNGYQRIAKICDTQQGELIEAFTIESERKTARKVVIKKVSRELHLTRSTDAKSTEDGATHCIPKDVLKEALILSHLTVNNQSTGNYIVRLLDFFRCAKFYYVVLEHVDNNIITLKDFVQKSLEYIRDGKLGMKQYVKVIKFIFWQIFVLIQWMHNDMNCCHLDLKLEHILLQNAVRFSSEKKNGHFIKDVKSGRITINPNISIKVCDFGSAELFRDGNFECNKEVSPLDGIQYKSPQIIRGHIYDAQKADIWALGMMFVHCVIGRPLYQNVHEAGFISVQRGTLQRYLKSCDLKRNMKQRMLNLVKNMLQMNESKRYSIRDVLKHEMFEGYYSKYKARIAAKSRSQKMKLSQQKNKLKDFPFYCTKDFPFKQGIARKVCFV